MNIKKLTFSALYMAIAMVLPFLTGQIQEIGSRLSPMHIPAFLCGFVCGWPWGLAVGFISPLLRSVIFGMPVLFPSAVAMAFELAAYGAFAGLFYRVFPRKKWLIYIELILAMIAGRIIWGIVQLILCGITGSEYSFAIFISGALLNAIPGIILHIALVPPLVIVLEKAGLVFNE